MTTPLFICGAECGLVAAGTGVPSGAVNHWTNFGATVSLESTLTSGAWSSRSYKFNPVAATSDLIQSTLQSLIASPATMVVRFNIMWTVLPDAIHSILSESGGLLGIRYNPTGTKLEAYAGPSAVGGVYAGSFVPSTNVWYRIDVKMVKGTTWTVDWQVDGAAQTQASKASQAASTIGVVRFGTDGSNAAASAAATATYYIDDMIVSGTSGDYPIGAGGVQGLWPNADGVHNYNAATDFKKNNSTNLNATSSLETTVNASRQSGSLSTSVSNFMAQAGGASTEYVAYLFDDATAAYSAINGLNLVSAHHSAGTTANNQSLRLLDGATEGVSAALVDWSDTTISFHNHTFAVAPSSGTAFTLAQVQAISARWGFATSIGTVPFIDGLMIEVDGPITPATSGAAKRRANRDGLIMSDAGHRASRW